MNRFSHPAKPKPAEERTIELPSPRVNTAANYTGLWYPGANYTVDVAVFAMEHLLLIRRKDTGEWALPGGFIDFGETAVTAGRREAREETNLRLTDEPVEFYRGPVGSYKEGRDPSWIETTGLLWMLKAPEPAMAGDDAAETHWVDLAHLPRQLYGSHNLLVVRAIAMRDDIIRQKMTQGQ